MDVHDEIRERIQERIAALELNPRRAALLAGLSETTLRKFLERETESMTVATLTKLAPALEVSAEWLLNGLTAEVIDIWERIPPDQRARARAVLEAFAESESAERVK